MDAMDAEWPNRAAHIRSALEGLFKVAHLTIMARSHFSLVNASGNGPRRHWKTDHCARSDRSNTIPLALVWWPTFRLARRHRERPNPLEHRPEQPPRQVTLGQHQPIVQGGDLIGAEPRARG